LDSEEYLKQREIRDGGLEKFVKKHHEKEYESAITSRSVHDVIELERHVAVLEKKLEEEKFSTIGHLTSILAHDMKNPLAIIRVTLENIKTIYGNDSTKQKQFDKVDRSIDRMVHQIDRVLDFVREQPLELNKTKMSEIIHESLESLNIPNNIKIIFPKNDVDIICDKKQLVIVMHNLILNGIQSIEGKGIVILSIDEKSDSVILEIEDSGSGISDDDIHKIFDPLFTTKQQGTGLGLTSVKSIISNHGGTISVTSPPTNFTITLPKIHL